MGLELFFKSICTCRRTMIARVLKTVVKMRTKRYDVVNPMSLKCLTSGGAEITCLTHFSLFGTGKNRDRRSILITVVRITYTVNIGRENFQKKCAKQVRHVGTHIQLSTSVVRSFWHDNTTFVIIPRLKFQSLLYIISKNMYSV